MHNLPSKRLQPSRSRQRLLRGTLQVCEEGEPLDTPFQRRRKEVLICQVDSCGLPVSAKGCCKGHYTRLKRGRPLNGLLQQHQKWSIEDCREIAATRGGLCLDQNYKSVDQYLIWQCAVGHTWKAKFEYILRSGSWCPDCANGTGERTCRHIMECILGVDFPSRRPSWLRIGKKSVLQLDGYNENMAIAFEYHGSQHYEPVRTFNGAVSDFVSLQQRDNLKRQMCWERGVSLVIVPEFRNKNNAKACIAQVEFSILQAGLKVPIGWQKKRSVDLSSARRTGGVPIRNEIRFEAEKRGGRCLSEFHLNNASKMEWECAAGHRWSASWAHIRRGRWCPRCAFNKNFRWSIDDAVQLAAKRSGECLSLAYTRCDIPLRWRCARGHEWSSLFKTVRKGHWCQRCGQLDRKTKQILMGN
jgi:hypothetical protein